jgi:membrane-associated protein
VATLYSFIAYFSPNLVAWLQASKYILLILGCIFEGPIVMVASGFLYRLGGFDLLPMYLALVTGDFIADIGWYCIGRFGARNLVYRYGDKFGITPRNIEKIEQRFNKYHDKILIISKLTMGFGFAVVTLVVAGILEVPFKKYATLNLLGGFVWTAFLLVIGYFFGNIYASITGPEKIAFVCLALVASVIILRLANKYLIQKNI